MKVNNFYNCKLNESRNALFIVYDISTKNKGEISMEKIRSPTHRSLLR